MVTRNMERVYTGQPQWAEILTFSVDRVEAREVNGHKPPNIVDTNKPFYFEVEFSGEGLVWDTFEAGEYEYEIRFFVEGLGEATERDLPLAPLKGRLIPDQEVPYVRRSEQFESGTLRPGIYMLGVVITFPKIDYMTGYRADAVFQVK